MTGVAMSNFLQRMLKRTEDEMNGDAIKIANTPSKKFKFSKSSWIKAVNNISPSQRKTSSFSSDVRKMSTQPINAYENSLPNPFAEPMRCPPRTASDFTHMSMNYLHNDIDYEFANPPSIPNGFPIQTVGYVPNYHSFPYSNQVDCQNNFNSYNSYKSPDELYNETPNIEMLVENFEENFVSPKKKSGGASNYVKKIVAAYEQKYGSRKTSSQPLKIRKLDETSSIRTSCSFQSEETKRMITSSFTDSYQSNRLSYTTAPHVDLLPNNIDNHEDEDEDEDEDDDKTVSINESFETIDLEMSQEKDEEVNETTNSNWGGNSNPARSFEHSMKRFWSDKVISLREEKSKDELGKKENAKLCRSVSWLNKAPKIIGAFLKKPVKVEDTAVDWIPLPSKKLPRKRSLKKLLSKLTRPRQVSESSDVSFTPYDMEMDHHDSGFGEKTQSTTSVSSLASDFVKPHTWSKSTTPQIERSSVSEFRTFPRSSLNSITKIPKAQTVNKDEDEQMEVGSVSSAKIMLHEVPREKLRMDLGPSFPSTALMSKSLDRQAISRLRYSCMDEVIIRNDKNVPNTERSKSDYEINKWRHSTISDNGDAVQLVTDLYKVEFLCSNCTHQRPTQYSKSGEPYDEPRKHMSDPIVSELSRLTSHRCSLREPLYDRPSPMKELAKRPLSFCGTNRPNFPHCDTSMYQSPVTPEKKQFATIMPRRQRKNLSDEFIRSISDL